MRFKFQEMASTYKERYQVLMAGRLDGTARVLKDAAKL
jgi:hypothetical protein